MKKLIFCLVLLFFILLFFVAFASAKNEEDECGYYWVGEVQNIETGQAFPIYSEKPMTIHWEQLMQSRVILTLPYKHSKERITVVYYIR